MKHSPRNKPTRYQPAQERLALLKIIELGNRQIEEGSTVRLAEVKRRLRARRSVGNG